jgi:hypothetical protein
MVLRNLIELRFWTEYICAGPEETEKFLKEVDIGEALIAVGVTSLASPPAPT